MGDFRNALSSGPTITRTMTPFTRRYKYQSTASSRYHIMHLTASLDTYNVETCSTKLRFYE